MHETGFSQARLHLSFESTIPRSQISNAKIKDITSLLVLEQIDGQKFRTHPIERGRPTHAALGLVDFDGDKDIDILTGHYASDTMLDRARLTVWQNE